MKVNNYYAMFGLLFLLLVVPLIWQSSAALNFLTFTLIVSIGAIGWNVLGGVAGQVSFGHAAFFGVGAYFIALWQVNFGLPAWLGFIFAIGAGMIVAVIIGYLSFRAGLRGSYFALVTLAFAEVCRVLANSFSFTGGASGQLLHIDYGFSSLQFENPLYFYLFVLALLCIALFIAMKISHSRLGAQLIAIKENEDAAKALGVDTLKRKLQAIAISGGLTATAGALYVQYFLYIDPIIAFSPKMSIEVLLATMVGGLGYVLGPLVGAFSLHILGEGVKLFVGDIPGVDIAIYGLVLIIAVSFLPRGLLSLVEKYSSKKVEK